MSLSPSFVLVAALAAAGPAGPKVSVMPIAGTDALDGEYTFSDLLEARATQSGFGEFTTRAQTVAALEDARSQAVLCGPDDGACWVNLGGDAKLDFVIVPTVAKDDGGTTLTLRLIDVHAESEIRRIDRPLTAPPQDAIDDALARLLFPARFQVSIVIDDAPPNATVIVDGVERGTTPLPAPITGLLVGEHAVELKLDGVEPLQARFSGGEGELVHINGKMTLDAVPDPEGPARDGPSTGISPLVLAGGGAVAVGAAVGAVCGFAAAGSYTGVYANREDPTITHEQKEGARTAIIALLACTGVTGTAAVAGAGLVVFGLLE